MYVIDYKHVLCFGPIEYQILLKLLRGGDDLTDSENERADQMYTTLVKMKKSKEIRQADRRNGYVRPVRSVLPHNSQRNPSESDVMRAITAC